MKKKMIFYAFHNLIFLYYYCKWFNTYRSIQQNYVYMITQNLIYPYLYFSFCAHILFSSPQDNLPREH